jgi:glutamine synthetase
LAALIETKKTIGEFFFDTTAETHLLNTIALRTGELLTYQIGLESVLEEAFARKHDVVAYAEFYREQVVPAMNDLRYLADDLETLVAEKYWPLPSYGDILYSVV